MSIESAAENRRMIQRLTDEARTLRAAAELVSEEADSGLGIKPRPYWVEIARDGAAYMRGLADQCEAQADQIITGAAARSAAARSAAARKAWVTIRAKRAEAANDQR